MHAYRTHTCGALRAADTGQTVRLSGWIHRKRDHGGLVFVDLRDHYGLTQLVLHPDTPGFNLVERLRAENERLKQKGSRATSLKVSEKGGLSVYGLGRFPVTLYKEQWTKLLAMTEEIRTFIKEHDAELKAKPEL